MVRAIVCTPTPFRCKAWAPWKSGVPQQLSSTQPANTGRCGMVMRSCSPILHAPAAWNGSWNDSTVDMNKPISQVWTFASGSNPDLEYETLQYTDGSRSCNCPGWTRRVAQDGTRSCKHTRSVDMKRADHQCTSTHRYEPVKPNNITHHAKTQIAEKPKLGQRRFAV